MKPSRPMITNIQRQPKASSSATSSGGAMALAIWEPVFTTATGTARSLWLNQRWLTLRPAVKNGDSAMPSSTRNAYRTPKELAIDMRPPTRDQPAAAQANIFLGPYLSTR